MIKKGIIKLPRFAYTGAKNMIPNTNLDIRVSNSIEAQFRDLLSISGENIEYSNLYEDVQHVTLKSVFSTLHHHYISLFKTMNELLPTREQEAHFWAEPSRHLIKVINITQGLHRTLKSTPLAINIDKHYGDMIELCDTFLNSSGGSSVPKNTEKVELYYKIPIFTSASIISVSSTLEKSYSLQLIGKGSYAQVFKYLDTDYQKDFVVKRALENLNDKELTRFKQEFDVMKGFSSPYIVEVFNYDEKNNQYIMEFMDYTLDDYIRNNNTKLSLNQRKSIGNQIIKAFSYIHSKNLLHRDISPKNILIRVYDDGTIIAKISDFGLVKNPELEITSLETEIKGYFNDPELVTEGFASYDIKHEIYALTKLLYFVLTGKTNVTKIKNVNHKILVECGLNRDKNARYADCDELKSAFKKLSE